VKKPRAGYRGLIRQGEKGPRKEATAPVQAERINVSGAHDTIDLRGQGPETSTARLGVSGKGERKEEVLPGLNGSEWGL